MGITSQPGGRHKRTAWAVWSVSAALAVVLAAGCDGQPKPEPAGQNHNHEEREEAMRHLSDKGPDYYTEKYRPQYHLSPEKGNMSDPNGMVYFEGEYHQFYQFTGRWGHAVSKDLLHWEHLPLAIDKDELGDIWSGSAVVDRRDTSGFFGGKPGLVAIFTHFKKGVQSQSLAYSSDKGRTWVKYEGNPVIPNPGLKDFRDPKVIWHEPTNRWVMAVSVDQKIRFYSSPDLKEWTMESEFGAGQGSHAAVWECPDLFELPVEGTDKKKWVLAVSIGNNPHTNGSTAQYFVGSFDGKTFRNENKPADVLWTDYGKDFYAAVSYSDIPEQDGRRIWTGWMSNWRYPFAMPTGVWKGNMSLFRELSLRDIPDTGVRLIQKPVMEYDSLRGKPVTVKNAAVTSGSARNPFSGLQGNSYELELDYALQDDSPFGVRLGMGGEQQTTVLIDPAASKLIVDRTQSGTAGFESRFAEKITAPLPIRDGKLKLRLFMDVSTLEVFANDGETAVTSILFPDPTSNGIELFAEGKVVLERGSYYPMRTVWRNEEPDGTEPLRVTVSKGILNLTPGAAETLRAAVLPLTAPQNIKWSSGDPSVAEVKSQGDGTASVRGIGVGETVVQAESEDGRISYTVNVFVTGPAGTH